MAMMNSTCAEFKKPLIRRNLLTRRKKILRKDSGAVAARALTWWWRSAEGSWRSPAAASGTECVGVARGWGCGAGAAAHAAQGPAGGPCGPWAAVSGGWVRAAPGPFHCPGRDLAVWNIQVITLNFWTQNKIELINIIDQILNIPYMYNAWSEN